MNRADRKKQAQLTRSASQSPGNLASMHAVMHSVEVSSYAGPLPHPDVLRGFEEVVPGSAQRIVIQFEQQSEHRRSMESTVIRSNTFSQRVGTVSASLIGLAGVSGGLWLTHEGKGVEGLSSMFGTLAALVGAYFYNRRQQDRERDEKRDPKGNK